MRKAPGRQTSERGKQTRAAPRPPVVPLWVQGLMALWIAGVTAYYAALQASKLWTRIAR